VFTQSPDAGQPDICLEVNQITSARFKKEVEKIGHKVCKLGTEKISNETN
jgi:hypothetical protein